VIVVQHGDKQRLPGDPGLTATGRQQAEATARWLARNEKITGLWSSPLRRARETSTPIADQCAVETTIDDRLRERMNWDDPERQPLQDFLDEWAHTSRDRDFVPTSGDSSNGAAARFLDFLTDLADLADLTDLVDLVDRQPDTTVVAVAHGGVTVDLLRTLIGDTHLRPAAPTLIDDGMPSGALTRLAWRDNTWTVHEIGWTGHLTAPAAT
jgi:broad specificity phosphatase PhoE